MTTLLEAEFIAAKWFTPTDGRVISLVVIHQTQSKVYVGGAEANANYFASLPASNKASAHRVYDPGTVVECVREKNVAYAAPGANHNGWHLELVGYSDKDKWDTPEMEAMMRLAAHDTAAMLEKHRLPIQFNYADALLKGGVGVTTHWEVSKAWKKTDHWDPGKSFPVGRYMELVRAAADVHLPHVPPGFNGGDMVLHPNAGCGFISSEQANLPGTGSYNMTVDGGIQAEVGTFIPAEGAWNYLGLPPQLGERFGTAITPNLDGSPGYTQWFNDGSKYVFGPGKNGWPVA